MNPEDRKGDLERITELSHIVNGVVCSSPTPNIVKLFSEDDIYHKLPQEVTILGETQKHKYSFFKRMKAKIELYNIYSKSEDEIIKKSIICEIGDPNIFYVICNSVITSVA